MMNYYDIRTEFNGKTLILPSDPDRIVFVNNQNNRWEDGTSITVDEMVSFLVFYGQDLLKPRSERHFSYRIWFVDGQGTAYGDSILFNEQGEPVLKIEDGIIKSNHVKCGCETRFPSPANLGIRTSNDYDWFREQIEDSGQFDKCKRKLFSSKERYQCRACKSIWILGKPDREGCYLWRREEDHSI